MDGSEVREQEGAPEYYLLGTHIAYLSRHAGARAEFLKKIGRSSLLVGSISMREVSFFGPEVLDTTSGYHSVI
jgi:hypothetical protein